MSKPGFSLLEFLISLTLLSFVIIATAQIIIHSFLVKRQAEINLKISELACAKLEYLKSLPYKSEELSQSQKSESLKGGSSQEIFIRSWRIQDISSSLKRIEIEVFSQTQPQKKARLALFICKELGF